MMGVYKILNIVDGKIYVGSSVDIQRRIKCHMHELRKGTHNNKYLQSAWNKYGENSFEFSVIEEVSDKSILRDREQYYIQLTNCSNHSIGYNLLNNTNVGLGVSASDEIKAKIRKACSGEKNGNYGRKHTEEELKRMYTNRWGDNYVKKPRVYKHKSDEEKQLSRKRMSEKMKHQIVSEETRRKLSEYRKGKHHSAETKAKFSEQRQGKLNANSKLSKEQVFEIYEKMNSGVNYKNVCKEYNIGQCWAYKIKKKEHWAFNDE